MILIPENPDALLTRDAVAAALQASGYPVKSKTLATKATRGGGPPYRLFGTRVLYRWGDALGWAQARLSKPRCCTSEADAVSRQPFVDSARALIAEGQDPSSVLEMRHAGSDHFALHGPIGVAAQFDVMDRARGTAFVRRTPLTDGCTSSQNSPAGCADEAGATVAPPEARDATSDDCCAKPARSGEPATANHRARRADGRHNAAKDEPPT